MPTAESTIRMARGVNHISCIWIVTFPVTNMYFIGKIYYTFYTEF